MNELIKLKIDGKEIEAIEGRPLVEVARENGINIPTLCHFKDIYPRYQPAASVPAKLMAEWIRPVQLTLGTAWK